MSMPLVGCGASSLPHPLSSSLMSTATPTDPNSAGCLKIMFDHEKLFIYQELLRFVTWVSPVIVEAKTVARGKTKEVCEQLDHASLSALLNTAEGNGKRTRKSKRKSSTL